MPLTVDTDTGIDIGIDIGNDSGIDIGTDIGIYTGTGDNFTLYSWEMLSFISLPKELKVE